MKSNTKMTKNEQIALISSVFDALRAQKVVNSQKDFAALLGKNEQTISAAMRGRDGYLTDSLVRLVESVASTYGISTSGDSSPAIGAIVGGDNQKILSDNHTAELLVQEMAAQREQYGKQIDRLLSIIEKMQG